MQHSLTREPAKGGRPIGLALLSAALPILPIIVLGAVSCGAEPVAAKPARTNPTFTCHRPVVIDGDTIRCSTRAARNAPTIKVRLLGIDAPEMGKCRRGRVCVDGDPRVSLNMLNTLLTQPPVTVQDFGRDRYGRTLGIVRVGPARTNVACPLIASGSVQYKPQWDNAGRIGKECGTTRKSKGGAA